MQVIFSERYGFPPIEGDDWKVELFDFQSNESLGYVTYYYTGQCLYVDTGGGEDPTELYCIADPSYDYVFYFVFTFYTQCLETESYYIRASNSGQTLPDTHFEPTPFQPKKGLILPGSLASVPPAISDVETGEIATVAVLVNDDLGCNMPVENAPIMVSNTIVKQSGSHLHFNTDDEIGTGQYVASIPPWLSSTSNNTSISSQTDKDGLFTANYRVGKFGLKEKISIFVTNQITSEKLLTEGELEIRIPGLVGLSQDGEMYRVLGSGKPGCDAGHNDKAHIRRSHYLLPEVMKEIESVAVEYNSRIDAKLSFNDASLEYGGFFDAGSRTSECHVSHRIGNDIDINKIDTNGNNIRTKTIIGANGAPELLLSILDDIFESNGGASRIVEETSIHYRYPK